MKYNPVRFSQYAHDLAEAIMKFRITEPTFFEQKERKPGEVMEGPVGPYRYQPGIDGKRQRSAQFEVIEEPAKMLDPVVPIATPAAVEVAPSSVTPALPPNQIAAAPAAKPAPTADTLKKTITGASALGADFKTRIAAAKSKLDAAKAQVGASLDNLDSAASRAVTVAAVIQAEADDLNASIGQVSNE